MNDRAIEVLRRGVAIPAHPLALTKDRKLDERRQRALSRYYIDAGVGGLAVGVHTTQFQIRDPSIGLYGPVLALAAEEMDRADTLRNEPLVRVAGICGQTRQAVHEAEVARELGYQIGLLSLSAMRGTSVDRLIGHVREVGRVLPIFGFYLQSAVGGMDLPYEFWRQFVEIDAVRAIKVAAFNRYQTIDVVRAACESERDDIALYTGNDDNIVLDLLTPFRFLVGQKTVERRFVGGLLGQWAVGTQQAVRLLHDCHHAIAAGGSVSADTLRRHIEVTDANAAIFDAANRFGGCIAGIHEVLRRPGLLSNLVLLDPEERLGPGQMAELDRVLGAYPHLFDDQFIRENLDRWLK